MSSEPRATFLMSTYNAGPFLSAAIESVLAQTEARWRLIVVDDASTDGSADVVREFSDSRITLVALAQNVGQTAALNLGLQRVQTEWVARLDQDDLAAPRRLELQLGYLAEHPATVLLGAWADFVDDQGKTVGHWRPAADAPSVRRALYLRSCPLVHSSVVYRTDVARGLGGYPTHFAYAQDVALWIAMAQVGEVAIVPSVVTYLRQHGAQTSRNPRALLRQMREALDATETLPADLAEEAATVRGWRARRLWLSAVRAYVAARAGDRQAASESARAAAKVLLTDPTSLLPIAALVYRKSIDKLPLG